MFISIYHTGKQSSIWC